MKKMFKLMLALAVALIPLLGTMPVSADSDDGSEPEERVIPEYITKYLQMPCNITFPDGIEFEFEFELIGQIVGGDRIAAPNPGPEIPSVTVTFDDTSVPLTATEIAATAHLPLPIPEGVCVYRETSDVFTADVDWIRPGHYIFLVTESIDTNDLPFLPGYHEEIRYDEAEFELHVLISQAANGTLYVSGTYAWNLGETSTGWTGEYTDPDNNLEDMQGKVHYISFLNTFLRRTQPTDECPEDDPNYPCEPPHEPCPPDHPDYPGCEYIPDPPCPEDDPDYPYCEPEVPVFDSALVVSKQVTGDQSYSGDVFEFTIRITPHALEAPDREFAFHLWTHVPGFGWTRGARTIVAPNTDFEFELSHNQMIVFEPILIGTTVVVTEHDYAPYTPSVTITSGGNNVTGTAPIGVNTTGNLPVLEGNNSASFLNTLNSVPITGLIMNNLPVILISIGAVGFVMMLVANKKRREYV